VTKQRRFLLLGIAFAVVAAFVITRVVDSGPGRRTLDLGTFEQKLTKGQVRSVTLLDRDHEVQGTLRDGTEFRTHFPDGYTDTLTKVIRRADV